MPAIAWPGTVHRNVYLPRLSVAVTVLVLPSNVGVAATVAPPALWIVKLWPSGALFVNATVTLPAFAVRLVLSNFSAPPGLAAMAILLPPPALGAAAADDDEVAAAAAVELVAGAAADELVAGAADELDELEPPHAATPSARAPRNAR